MDAPPVPLPRPTSAEVEAEFTQHVRALAGPDAAPRPEQLAAVTSMLAEGRRTLLVARTGFGKSAVYFSATRMLRDRGWGPTIVVSPLLALMRDQIAAAERLGLKAVSINSSNVDDWHQVEADIAADRVDLLLIAPERFANQVFRDEVFHFMLERPFALVCDEAHCISDWGHDFRPDYLRLRRLLDELPPNTPVLATTATANHRVTVDVASQLGSDTRVLRTSLDRASLHLSAVELDTDAERWAWISAYLDQATGSGIIYTLTVDQAERLAAWLAERGHRVEAYTGQTDTSERVGLEEGLRSNELKALVATSALGMGFDKPDMAFCLHLGLPPTPVAYYQQVGRAGRAIERADVVSLPRPGDDQAVWRWFEQVSLPPKQTCDDVLMQMSAQRPVSIAALETMVNLGRSRLSTLLSILEVHGAIDRTKGGYVLADPQWNYDVLQAARLSELRRDEAAQMLAYPGLTTCRMRYLREQLDDGEATDCGRCDICTGVTPAVEVDPDVAAAAQLWLDGGDIAIEPRKMWPSGVDGVKGRIAASQQFRLGRALSRPHDGGWSAHVDRLLDGNLDMLDRVAQGLVGVLKRWDWEQRPTWICPMPSRAHGAIIDAVSDRLGAIGKLPVYRVVEQVDSTRPPQRDQANSAHQVANVLGAFAINQTCFAECPTGPVLLIDDTCSSRWTLTVVASLLGQAGSGHVLPLVLQLE
jgi:ATP-dependent DNA helicase RecQ